MPDTWTIRVCEHGLRVQWFERYGSWLHMEAPSYATCEAATPPRVAIVVEVARETLHDAYRRTPAHESEARGMLAMLREHNRHGLRGDPVMNTTNERVAFLKGFIAAEATTGGADT